MDSLEEYLVKDIINTQWCGCRWQYLIQWVGYGPEHNHWLTSSALEECMALNWWLDLSRDGPALW